MSVTSRPAPSGAPAESKAPRERKESAVVSRAQLRRQRGAVERYSAFVVLLVSFIGTIVAFNGGWAVAMALRFGLAATASAVALQVILTFLEWHYYDRPLISWGARLVDTATTAAGYGPLILPLLAGYVAGKGVGHSTAVAWAIIALASLGIAWYPESRLIGE